LLDPTMGNVSKITPQQGAKTNKETHF